VFWKLWSWITYFSRQQIYAEDSHNSHACVFCNRCFRFVIESSYLTTFCFCKPVFNAIVWTVPYKSKWILQLHKDFPLFNGTTSQQFLRSRTWRRQLLLFLVRDSIFVARSSRYPKHIKGDTAVLNISLVLISIHLQAGFILHDIF
jgi:hypothetical protein